MNAITVPSPVQEFLGRVVYEAHLMRPLLPTYLHLLISAIFPIWSAAHAALVRPKSAAPRKREEGEVDDDEEADEETSTQVERLSVTDAIIFPVMAGFTLTALYFILKWLQDPAWLNYILGLYFSQLGMFFAVKFIKDILAFSRSVVFPAQYSLSGKLWRASLQSHAFERRDEDGRTISNTSPLAGPFQIIPIPERIRSSIWILRRTIYKKAILNLRIQKLLSLKMAVDILDLVSFTLSAGIVYWHTFKSKPWFLTNILGFSFCYGSLQFVTPGTSLTGTLLLCGLFFYDIYMVFYTPMMVAVATKLDVPIKLLFPRPDGCSLPVGASEGSEAMEEYLRCLAKKRTMAMLGLGDIVIPGMMLAYALRFDLYLFYLKMKPSSQTSETTKNEVHEKPTYIPARGGWGERFWTSRRLWSKELTAKTFPKPYFYATVFGYLFGMIATVVVMQVYQHAQPALLYLVPGVLISLWGTALVKGDLKQLWNYSEVLEDNDTEQKKDEKKMVKPEEQANHDKVENKMTQDDGPQKGEEDTSVSSEDGSLEKITWDDTKPEPAPMAEAKTIEVKDVSASTSEKQVMSSPEKATSPIKDPEPPSSIDSPYQLISFSITLPSRSTQPTLSNSHTRSLGEYLSNASLQQERSITSTDSDQKKDEEKINTSTARLTPDPEKLRIKVHLQNGRSAILGREDTKTLIQFVDQEKSGDGRRSAGEQQFDFVKLDGEPRESRRRRKG